MVGVAAPLSVSVPAIVAMLDVPIVVVPLTETVPLAAVNDPLPLRVAIDAELVPTTSQVNGRETVRYVNRSPDTLATIWIFLNQNLFASTAPRLSRKPASTSFASRAVRMFGATPRLSRNWSKRV